MPSKTSTQSKNQHEREGKAKKHNVDVVIDESGNENLTGGPLKDTPLS